MRGGKRTGAGRPKGTEKKFTSQMRHQLHRFNDRMEAETGESDDLPGSVTRLMRPEEIILRISNGMKQPNGQPFTSLQFQAAQALLPYSIAKPASVSIHHVQRTDSRQYTDEELERIANASRGSNGTFAAAESPLLALDVVRDGDATDGSETSEAPSLTDFGITTTLGDA